MTLDGFQIEVCAESFMFQEVLALPISALLIKRKFLSIGIWPYCPKV